MANNGNLKPFNSISQERHRELSRRGGIASGAARREKRERIEAEKIAMIAARELERGQIPAWR